MHEMSVAAEEFIQMESMVNVKIKLPRQFNTGVGRDMLARLIRVKLNTAGLQLAELCINDEVVLLRGLVQYSMDEGGVHVTGQRDAVMGVRWLLTHFLTTGFSSIR